MDEPSRPARGAWIEITLDDLGRLHQCSRAPHGARGLKFYGAEKHVKEKRSRPARGATHRNDFGFKQPDWESRLKNKKR